jgi:RNA-dependent RNA polymerase
VAYAWDGVRVEVVLAKRRVDLYLEHDSYKYMLEVLFRTLESASGAELMRRAPS